MAATTIDKSKEWTVDDYLQLREMNTCCQLVDGELIVRSSSPYHQIVSGNLYDLLKGEAKRLEGIVFFAPMDLYIDNKNVFQPDLMYISRGNKKIITHRGVEGAPDLIVEILSPFNIFTDRNRKKKVYQEIGVKEYWIVDPASQTLEIYLNDQENSDTPHLYLVSDGIVSSTVLTNLRFDLKDIF